MPDLRHAIEQAPGNRALVLNLVEDDETPHLTPVELLRVFKKHAPGLRIDVVIIDEATQCDYAELKSVAHSIGAEVFAYNVAQKANPAVHDPLFLAAAFREVIDSFSG